MPGTSVRRKSRCGAEMAGRYKHFPFTVKDVVLLQQLSSSKGGIAGFCSPLEVPHVIVGTFEKIKSGGFDQTLLELSFR